ncbi:MAG: peptidase S8 and S53 subtilisin kexin sedolisin [Streptomycetaceae bacterium]|nr:peptidase S8 and S53 subtilisin kexin sedolisin [Streptomycetaceae bacterium]
MFRPARRWIVAAVSLTLAFTPAAASALTAPPTAKTGTAGLSADPSVRDRYTPAGCNQRTAARIAQCYAMVLTGTDHRVRAAAAADGPPATALGPADIRDAYKLPDTGQGQTVAIVDALGNSHAEADLAVFRSHYGLPACTTANGCFRKVDQRGGTAYPADDPGWGLETALDLDAVSAACPNCHILLVQGDSATVEDLAAAEDTAVRLGAGFVSNSYGVPGEFSQQLQIDEHYTHPGTVITASTGDTGYIVNYPASSPAVVAVGGTSLTRDGSARGWHEAAWGSPAGGPGAGSGCSVYEAKPAYQNGVDTGCGRRAIADLSAVADPATGLGVYDTTNGGWLQVGGTSLSAPLMAAMYALAGRPAADTDPVAMPYHDPQRAAHVFDVTDGAVADCGTQLCQAAAGWDGPTGLGSPNGVGALTGGPHGRIAGRVTDADGEPIAGATVKADPGAYASTTAADGTYAIDGALVGTYTMTFDKYGYGTVSGRSVTVAEGQTATADVRLQPVDSSLLTGTVTDGGGHGWPLYSRITIDGYPGGAVYTDPFTGAYAVRLVDGRDYTVHVEPVYPGYEAAAASVHLGGGDVRHDVRVAVDLTACSAPGYRWNGYQTGFSDRSGWKSQGWVFDNPTDRSPPLGGDDTFALAEGRGDAYLTSPVVNLSGQSAPQLRFDSSYYAKAGRRGGQRATVDLSVDGGRRWTTVWRASDANVLGPQTVALPQAAGRTQARVRFHYEAADGWWWGVDDVFLGTHTCVTTTGGLVAGVVTARAAGTDTASGIDNATVTGPTSSALSAASDDPAVPHGFYWLFANGAGTYKATAAGYATASDPVTAVPDKVTRKDWTLTEGAAR